MEGLLNSFLSQKQKKPDAVPEPDMSALAAITNFSKRELKRLFARYCMICNKQTGLIEKIPFIQQPELVYCPIGHIAFDMERRNFIKHRAMLREEKLKKDDEETLKNDDDDDDKRSEDRAETADDNKGMTTEDNVQDTIIGEADLDECEGIDFFHFVKMLSEFSPKASLSRKISYFFKMIATDDTQTITKDNYLDFLKNHTYGMVPAHNYDDIIDDMWDNILQEIGHDAPLSRKDLSKLVTAIDMHLLMTISY
mmetsp:Transcript_13540/g.20331  ORF Transcript_13540/g.20331 Transcript_13540/m.20331 type:complete len:253 (+) Transcript_13540:92-850(+)